MISCHAALVAASGIKKFTKHDVCSTFIYQTPQQVRGDTFCVTRAPAINRGSEPLQTKRASLTLSSQPLKHIFTATSDPPKNRLVNSAAL